MTTRPRPKILTRVTDEGEVLVTMPDGQMVFMGFWEAARFVLGAVFRGFEVGVDDGR